MLRARVVTALVLAVALLCVLFLLPPAAAAAALGLIALAAAWEWAGLMRIDPFGRLLFAGVTALFCWQGYVGDEWTRLFFLVPAAGFWLLLSVPWLRRRWSMAGNDFVGYLLGLVLIVAAWIALVQLHARGVWVLIGVMAIAWISDIAAYFAGRRFGKHKLAPQISPGKTWEGVIGGVAGVLIYGICVVAISGMTASPARLLAGAILLLLLTALGIVGDLFESLLKRQAGIKDSSALLPGHGGVLDRIDSLLAILPVAALVLNWSGQ